MNKLLLEPEESASYLPKKHMEVKDQYKITPMTPIAELSGVNVKTSLDDILSKFEFGRY